MSDAAFAVADSLRVIASFTHSKGARLAFLNQDWRSHQTVYIWPAADSETYKESQKKPEFWFQSRWWIDKIRTPKFVCYQDIEQLPAEARADLGLSSDAVLKGLCLLPIYDGKRLGAILQLDNPSQDHPLRDCDIQLISTASATILHLMFDPTQAAGIFNKNTSQAAAGDGLSPEKSNREFFEDLLREVIRRKGRLFEVVLVELDNLASGPQNHTQETRSLLVETAVERIRGCLRVSDIVLHLDHNLIGVLLIDVFETESAQTIAERLQVVAKTPFHLSDETINLHPLIGAARPESGENQAEGLMAAAENALILARERGRKSD